MSIFRKNVFFIHVKYSKNIVSVHRIFFVNQSTKSNEVHNKNADSLTAGFSLTLIYALSLNEFKFHPLNMRLMLHVRNGSALGLSQADNWVSAAVWDRIRITVYIFSGFCVCKIEPSIYYSQIQRSFVECGKIFL